MRFILILALLFTANALTVYAQEESMEERAAKYTYLNGENGGIACGITSGEFKKATYKKPEPKKFTINASAYTAAADECGKSDGITASGKKVKANQTIACPKNYAFGTKIHIEGMGTYECQDRGGAIKGNKFDIYMETKDQAFAFGRKNLTAYVVI